MTTLVALASKHAVVVGADSLGTATRRLVDVMELFKYFDPANGLKLRDGSLTEFWQVFGDSASVPYNQLLHVNKLFRLGTLPAAAMFTGITSIGQNTIRSLIGTFSEHDEAIKDASVDYTIESLSQRLLNYLKQQYDEVFTQEFLKEELELLIAGYDRTGPWPTVLRIDVRRNTLKVEFTAGEFGIGFGGQMDWIQRIVFGTDTRNQAALAQRVESLLGKYRENITSHLSAMGYAGDIPAPESFGDELKLFSNWSLNGLRANWAEFSEQNAIDCVDFFLRIMIQSQDVSEQLPTVGGNVHIAVIRRDGFYPVTKEVWRHGDHEVATPESGRRD